MKSCKFLIVLSALITLSAAAWGADVGALNQFAGNTTISATAVNQNFDALKAGVNTKQDKLDTACIAGQALANVTQATGAACTDVGTITTVTAGSGLTGGGASGAVTLSADTTVVQARVTGTCAVGQYVTAIAANGTVPCGTDANSGGTITSVTGGNGVSASTTAGAVTLGIATGGITSAHIADNSITGADILNGTITGTDIAAGTVTGSNIAAGTITNSNISASAAIDATKVLGAAGLDSGGGSTFNLAAGVTVQSTLNSVSITVPRAGYIFATYSGMAKIQGVNGSSNYTYFFLSSSLTAVPTTWTTQTSQGLQWAEAISAMPSGTYSIPVSGHAVYAVTSGTVTITLYAQRGAGTGSASIFYPRLYAIFVPRLY